MSRSEEDRINLLKEFSACDVGICLRTNRQSANEVTQVSDALLKLEKPEPGKAAKAGYLADIGKHKRKVADKVVLAAKQGTSTLRTHVAIRTEC